ncbi:MULTISPECIES: hypothetical protein [unclassified Actinotalea]|uniref:hypothetical protein n=1 Tax=unclassified Actinotalea TaxID=2638618 RepID=UPI0015F45EB7|nr:MULTISPECIES: hypothetical protein [unclassified Actinotalea]
MNDLDTLTTAQHGTAPLAAAPRRDGVLRPVLWLTLLALAVANVTTSVAGLVAVSVPLGLGVLACVAALVVHHRRTRS